MSKVCEIDSAGLNDILNNLSPENRKEAIFKSLVKGGEELVQQTVFQLTKELPAASEGNRFGRPMTKGVRLKKDKDYDDVIVSVMGDFRLKFFELGTKERYLKRTGAKDRIRGYTPSNKSRLYRKKGKENQYSAGSYRGMIKPLHFFKQARDNSQSVMDKIINSLSNEIAKLMHK